MNFIDLAMVSFLLFVFAVLALEFGPEKIKQAVCDAVNVIKLWVKKEK